MRSMSVFVALEDEASSFWKRGLKEIVVVVVVVVVKKRIIIIIIIIIYISTWLPLPRDAGHHYHLNNEPMVHYLVA